MLRVRSGRCAILGWLCLCSAACGPSDPSLQIAVDQRLSRDPQTASLSVDVSILRGVIHLSGEVASRDQQRRAVELTRSVDGVNHVVDEMHLSDKAIVAAVKAALAADPLVGRVPIEIDSNAGSIRLMSDQTDKDQRARAMEISAKVDGVRHVEDRMR